MDAKLISWTRQAARSGAARAIREAAGLSVRELAEAVGVSPAAISRYERGLRSPRAGIAERYGRALRQLAGGGA